MINRGDRKKRNDPNLASKAHFIVCQFQFRSNREKEQGEDHILYSTRKILTHLFHHQITESGFNQKKKLYKKELL